MCFFSCSYFFFFPKLYSSRTLLISLLSNAVWSSKPKRTISMVRNGSGHSPEQQNKKNSISGWACCLTSTTVASEENKTLFRDYCRKQWVWRDAYLKTARLRDQSTSGFLSSNFARLFIRCRPPNIKAAYSAENRNDFFLQNKNKKAPVKCCVSTRQIEDKCHVLVHFCGRKLHWGRSCSPVETLLLHQPTRLHVGLGIPASKTAVLLEKESQIWFLICPSLCRLFFCEDYRRSIAHAGPLPRHTSTNTTRSTLCTNCFFRGSFTIVISYFVLPGHFLSHCFLQEDT